MGWIVGAYSASPTRDGWVPKEEEEYLEGIFNLKNLAGLEVPFTNSIHKFDEDWFIQKLLPALSLVFTLIPGTTASVKENPLWGIASIDKTGRESAIEFIKSSRESLKKVNDAMGVNVVKAIQIHSAPDGRGSSRDALADSLAKLHQVDWEGAEIVIEHCDALISGQPSQKGYMSLSHELEAINLSGTPTQITINWGRSAIEKRSAAGPIEHIIEAQSSNRLSGIMFSGASAVDNRFGNAWADCHVPPAPLDQGGSYLLETSSLMTLESIRNALRIVTNSRYIGLKVAPLRNISIAERIETVAQSLEVLEIANSSLA
jgi:hypothetical protein